MRVSDMNHELFIMHSVAKLLSQLEMPPRRRAVNWINGTYESLPLTDKRGKVISEETPDTDPPILKFIGDHKAEHKPNGPDEAAEAGA